LSRWPWQLTRRPHSVASPETRLRHGRRALATVSPITTRARGGHRGAYYRYKPFFKYRSRLKLRPEILSLATSRTPSEDPNSFTKPSASDDARSAFVHARTCSVVPTSVAKRIAEVATEARNPPACLRSSASSCRPTDTGRSRADLAMLRVGTGMSLRCSFMRSNIVRLFPADCASLARACCAASMLERV
jgi:hypothetical protein